ncbi:hypothetical protein LTR10_021876 [Elasticomyces elasticus]|uniref:Uncharacterized protein n=1 Tax=Exophiala sideris TaxID=1016849 RepID=A0ABR0JR89_9EURO|nr:hypothetical protein LTR10_021876 [Elasticomyces elasticus]KAK5039813.1 hypothetical protein LTS07_000308 [Exophiala sideris]KAK5041365.1 hypothetical protein LTR13_002840 [Exophiala sideris]KAK5068192.1 hypothetical protein LTR69_000310 [Exophiala sideris]KAK5187493.1 hypothetical protein LTR44_000309 [Eurotiomycetes sp. CCFEE 6388]
MACACRVKRVPNESNRHHYKGEGTEDDIVLADYGSRYLSPVSSVASSSGSSLGFNNSFEARDHIGIRLTSTNLAQHDTTHRAPNVREEPYVDDEDIHPFHNFISPDSSGMIGAETMEIDSLGPGLRSGEVSMYASHHEGAMSRGAPSVTTSQMIYGTGAAFGSQIHQFLSLTPDCRHVRAVLMCHHCGHH